MRLAQKHLSPKSFAYRRKGATAKSRDPRLGEGKFTNLPYFKKHENCTFSALELFILIV